MLQLNFENQHCMHTSSILNKSIPRTHSSRTILSLTKALFSSPQKPKTFQDSSSHRILRHMHGTLNIDKNKN